MANLRANDRIGAGTATCGSERGQQSDQGSRAVQDESERISGDLPPLGPGLHDFAGRPQRLAGVEAGRLAGSRHLDDRPP